MERPMRSEKSLGKIYFLRSARNSENLIQAFDSLSREQFSPEWINRKGVERLANDHPGAILIVDSIDSTEFIKIRKICRKTKNSIVRGFSLRIFTAYALLSINPSRIECLPQCQYPITSTCMKPLRISISGLGPKRTKELSRKLVSMGATYQTALQKSTRILVSNSWQSTKVTVWRKCDIGLPDYSVVSPEWVERCYERREDIKDANSVIEKYRLPVFHGMKFCLSGFHSAERTRIHKILEDNGGSYSQALILPSYKFDGEKTQSRSQVEQSGQSLTTHLIVCKKEGPKYESAMALPADKIHIVNNDWFTISWTKSYPQIESDPRYSARDPLIVEEMRRKALQKKQRAVLSCSINSDTSFMDAQPNISTTQQETPSSSPPAIEKIIEEMENIMTFSTPVDCSLLFKDLYFYICGLTTSQTATVKRMISRCGGNVYGILCTVVTHVILGANMTSKDALAIKRVDDDGTICKVSVYWILRCIRKKTLEVPQYPQYLDPASVKLLGRVNSTQDLDPIERQELARERAEPKASVMSAKFKELEASSDNRNNNKNANKKGLRIGGTTPRSPFRITAKTNNELIPCSIPVEYNHES